MQFRESRIQNSTWTYSVIPCLEPLYLAPLFVFISNNFGTVGDFYESARRDTFYQALTKFTQDGENVRFLSNLVFAEDGTIEVPNFEIGGLSIIVVRVSLIRDYKRHTVSHLLQTPIHFWGALFRSVPT